MSVTEHLLYIHDIECTAGPIALAPYLDESRSQELVVTVTDGIGETIGICNP